VIDRDQLLAIGLVLCSALLSCVIWTVNDPTGVAGDLAETTENLP